MAQAPDLYQLLGVSAGASAAEITSAYRRLLRRHHPDSAPPATGVGAEDEAERAAPAEVLRAIMEAYEVLHDPASRAEYDRRHEAKHRRPRSTGPARPAATATGDRFLLGVTPVSWEQTRGAAGGPAPARPTAPVRPVVVARPVPDDLVDLVDLLEGLLGAGPDRRRSR